MKHYREGIAIIGIGAIMPGALNKDAFWKNILEEKSSIIEVPPDRWDWHLYYDPDPKAVDKTYSKIGGFIEGFKFDPIKHRIPPQVAGQMARLQHMAVETSVMALKDSGYDKKPYNSQRTAVILGNAMGGMKKEETDLRIYRAYYNNVLSRAKSFSSLSSDSRQAILEEVDQKISTSLGVITEDTMPGELSNVTAGRIASVLNVNGPNFTVDAACASAIAALDQAVKGLQLNDFDMAICGGADEMMSPPAYVKFCKIGALSPDGSWVFDARANGFVMAEGVGMFVLKRISDAVKDGDRIYAVINAIGSSSDGKGKGITAPNPNGQKLAIERAFQQLDYGPAEIGFMEAHGTATKAGDVAEGEVLNGFFSPHVSAKGSIGLGSVKSNIGHTKAAAGAASMVKTALALHNKILPPSINFVTPNPNIDFKNSPFRMITKLQEWASPNRPRRANVSSFGFGGTNFHVALEEYDEKTTRLPDPRLAAVLRGVAGQSEKPPELKVPSLKLQSESITISAPTREALLNKVDSLIASTNMDENWPMILFTHPFNTSRHEHFAVSLTADSPSKLRAKLKFLTEQAKTGRPWEKPSLHLKMKGIYQFHPPLTESGASKVKTGFLFPGQGSQYVDMMKDLACKYQIVQDTFDEADVILKKLINTTLTEVLYSKQGEGASELAKREEAIKQTQMTQPAVLTADTAMLRLLDSFGVRPDMVCGHSLGEYAAAIAAGIFTFENGIRAVTSRAKEMSNIKVDDPGKMASIALSFNKVEMELKKIKGYVICANKNCPTQTVIAGEKTAVSEAIKLFTSMGVQAGEIPVSHAFHCAIIQPAAEPYGKFLETIPVSKPAIPILSNVTADYFPSDEKGIRDLFVGQIVSPVEFIRQLERMYADGARLFVECGPKRVLSAFATSTLQDKKDIRILSSNHPKRGGILEFNDMLSNLTAAGININWNGKNPLDSGNVYTPAYAGWANAAASKEPAGFPTEVTRTVSSPSSASQKYGFNSNPIVITGIAAGTPGSWDKVFREGNIDEILRGQNLIEPISRDMQQKQIDKNIVRVIKSATGDHRIERLDSVSQAIKLAAVKGEFDLEKEFGVPKTVVNAMDSTFRMSMAAGILALKDAGLPLVRLYKKTSTGSYLPDRWALPESVGNDTGVIFASAFPIAESIITEVSDHLVERFRNQSLKEIWTVYDSMIQKIHDPKDRQALSTWFARNFNKYHEAGGKGPHTFSQDFLLKAIPIGNSQFAQWVRARGPSMHLSAACASTTESIGIAEDWIRTGRAKRVVVIAADDITTEAIQDWYMAGFVASGAATTEGKLSEAALPFDRRRHGLIVGSGAVGIVVEDETLAKERGMKPLVRLLGCEFANSGFHITRLDTNHVAEMLDRLMTKVEKIHGLDRSKIANKTLFMSHETYTPARGGSASAEVVGLKKTFGKDADKVIVSNVKGFTGHTMGASLEDVVAVRSLNTGLVPPIANYKEPDPELAGITLSKGGKYDLEYALHFAAGFGSQMAATFVQRTFKEGESRFEDPARYKNWLQKVSGNAACELEVEFNTLRIKDAGAPEPVAAATARPAPALVTAASTPVPVTARPVPRPSPTAKQAPYAPASETEGEIRETILNMISGKTGYPKDMLELDLDMEADLGIDTVKQAELFAAIREHYSIPRREGAALKDYPTIRHCIKFVMEEKGSVTGAAGPAQQDTTPVPAAPVTPHTSPLTPHATVPGMETEVREIILGMISDKTGYPKDMLELDLDMEADLGIDTVKQAELFAAIREHYSIPRREGAALKDYPTIRHCIKFVVEEKGSAAGAAPAATPQTTPAPAPAPLPSTLSPHTPEPAPVSRHVRYVPTLVHCPLEKEIIRKLSSKKPIVIFSDDAALTKAFSTELENLKAVYHIFTSLTPKNRNTTTLDWMDLPSVEKALTAFAAKNPKVQGVIYLLGCESKKLNENTLPHDDLTRMAIPLFLAGKHFNNGLSNPDESLATFMAVVTRVDGAFGYRTDSSYDPIYGAVSAIAYCLRKELPKSSVKLVDFSPAMTPSAIAKKTLSETLRGDARLGIGYHSGERWTLIMKPVTLAKDKGLDLKGKSVLVTGGGRGLGAEFSKLLAARHQPRIIIMDIIDLQDRTPQWAAMTEDQLKTLKNEMWTHLKSSSGRKATPVMLEKAFAKVMDSIQLYRTMEDIKKLGSEAAYFFCDVTDHNLFNDVMYKIRSKYGKIDGIAHFAGIERSKLAVDKTLDEFFKVFDTKAVSAMMLVNSGVIKEGGFKVFISSIAGRFGNVGQTDYAAASDYLSKLAVSLTNRGERALSVDMSAYANIGMATRPGVETFLKSQNVEFLYPREGMEVICDELVYGKVPEIILSAGLGKLDLDKQLETAGPHPARSVAGYPMIEQVAEHEHGKKLLAVKEFSLEKDPYLRDHSIGGTPYVPGVMGIETFVETANLFWKKAIHGLENVSFPLPVKLLRDKPVEIRINAVHKPGDALEMSMESDFVNPQGVKLGSSRTHFTARTVKSQEWRSLPQPYDLQSVAILETDKFEVSPDTIYSAFFHGPSYKVLGGILKLDQKSLLSVYKKPSSPMWPEDPSKNKGMLAHPLLIEAALQTCGYRDIHFTKRMTLPDAIKRVLIFDHGEEPGMLFVYSLFKGQDNSGKSIYDAFVFDKDGKLWIELNDYLMIPVEP